MSEQRWQDNLTIDMIPDGMCRAIAEKIGINNLIELTKLAGGLTFYVPKAESILKPARDMCIKKEFNGYNAQKLAIKYGLSEKWVRELCYQDHVEGQLSLFDEPHEINNSNS